MADLRNELRAFAQAVVEVFTALTAVKVRTWPPAVRVIDNGADDRIAAVRAGRRKVGPLPEEKRGDVELADAMVRAMLRVPPRKGVRRG